MTAATVAVSTVAVLAVLFAAARRVLLVVTVHGASMYPALAPGDRILVLRGAAARRPRGGHVVVLRSDRIPGAGPGGLLVKRVAARPGDPLPPGTGAGFVPDGHLAVLGDNPEVSTDSRVWGPVPAASVAGVMVGRILRAGPRHPAPPRAPHHT
ncbi:S26 family signal peptidase [Streptomyces sp. t39]|uniref:S26 family signal peptidase n=1 Tax=Streptomyces sp. t39 TaxID=1828156 RepID=UPI0011CEA5EC|nr:S26 family signal peptidase [Streptomyces sp. t39]TXS52288.1 S26 family signal peptidase [Streptomyces sp. t39]